MEGVKNYDSLDIEQLVDLLDEKKTGTVSLDRLLALSSKFKKDRDNEETYTVKKTALSLLKAFVMGAVIVVAGIFAFIGLEYSNYETKVEENLALKSVIENSLPLKDNITAILAAASSYDTDLEATVLSVYETYENDTLWDYLDDYGFVSHWSLRNPWKFESAGWFIFTIATTIGYGAIVPNTNAGYIFVIFYSIPAMIWMAYFVKQLINFYKSCNCKELSVNMQVITLPFLFAVYLGFSGWLFSAFEDWTVIQGTYYTWVTISTIGFGDYTVGNDSWWENILHLFVILNGLFLATYVLTVVGNVIEHVTKPERWKEVFNKKKLMTIELMKIPIFSKMSPTASGTTTPLQSTRVEI